MSFLRLIVPVISSCILVASVCHAQEADVGEAIAEAAPTTASKPAPDAATAAARPITVAVGLVDETVGITGTLSDTNSLSIKTAFGSAELPLSEVAGIRFPRRDDTATTVVMLNGDSITGATDVKFINVETTWGSAKINGQNIAAMLFVPGLAWQSQDVLGSKRWILIESQRANATQPGVSGAVPGQPGTNPSNPQLSQPSAGQPRIINPQAVPAVPGRVSN
jgi:hypothetical protein